MGKREKKHKKKQQEKEDLQKKIKDCCETEACEPLFLLTPLLVGGMIVLCCMQLSWEEPNRWLLSIHDNNDRASITERH